MKNFIFSLITICLSFFVTVFILKLSNKTTSSVEVKKDKNIIKEEAVIVEENKVSKELLLLEDDVVGEAPVLIEEKIKIASANSLDYSDKIINFNTWDAYNKENIELSMDFIAIDEEGNKITKKLFLEALKTGKYIPVKLLEEDYMYQLYSINENEKKKISKSIKGTANIVYNYFLKEAKPFPEFSFKDINGNLYNNENTKGNTLVIMCWFTQCTTCVQEFPVLNNLYDRYEGHDNVIFISLAFDEVEKLKRFLSKKEFRYPVIAEQKKFIKDEIGVIQYPTHLIVDKYGNIKKMVDNVDSLTLILDVILN